MSLPLSRLLGAAAILAVAVAGALVAGGPFWAALIGLIGGSAATLVAGRADFLPPPAPAADEPSSDRGPWAGRLLGAIGEPMLLVDSGRIAVANDAAKQLLGGWIEGQDVRLALRDPATVARLSNREPPGETERIEVAGLGDAGRRWLMTISALGDGSRLVHLHDRSEAIAAERMRVDFVANASHELRTPLATLLGFIETLEDDSAGAEREIRSRFLALMHGEGKRMQQLIEDLMSLSRIEAERFSAPRDPVDLVQVVEEVRSGCAQLLAERSNRLEVENGAESCVVPGDRGQLLQLFRNLLVNAVRYGRPDSPVAVRFAEGGRGTVRIDVIDLGEGIAVEHLPRLTERFYRVDPGRSRAVGGTGLGLAIVKHIVGRHRGRLDIRSKVGEGTTVSVWLPRDDEALS
ncbi:MAG TPA: ATP-binding protein [Allosphingosinicella sp.]|jgi:two-component system phosphate regulon sensor histidine kinase PhoR|nr:ATP-binding protein [Allosphingosinicella sp.]